MPLVATLIADPAVAALSPALVRRALETTDAAGHDWLAEGIACDIHFAGIATADETEAGIREAMAGTLVDVVVQEIATRRKRLLIADMDSTMIGQECIDELAGMVGLKDHVAAITARAMNGEIAFEPALRERVALLRGLPASLVAEVIETRITLMPGGVQLVRTMKRDGAYTALVSGGFTAFTGPVAAMIGFDENRANVLEENGGTLTGTVREPILGRDAKTEALAEISARLGISPADAIAVGDGANDLGMLALAGSGVALHAKPSVAAQARMHIDHSDLTALLYIQGYRQSDFVT
jgi:phosphoserine phosphatase